jgi:hypothetical protein
MRWSLLAALLAASLVIVAACGDDPDVAVLGATVTQPESAQFAATEPAPGSSSLAPSVSPTQASPIEIPTSSALGTTTSIDENRADRLGAAAEALIAYPFRSVLDDWSIEFAPNRESVRGLTFPQSQRIEVYVRDGDTAATVARVLAHEVGHAIDVSFNDDADRASWRSARGIADTTPWWPNGTTFDFDTASGDWAESFAVMQTGATHQGTVAGPLSAEQLDVLAGLLP